LSFPDTQTKVDFLRRCEAYPDQPRRVDVVETHMSWVFLTDRYAYKLKKPVRYDFLDFSTLQARHRDCEEELRLNRPLAGDVYLELVSLAVDESGDMQLQGPGTVVDRLVKMRRLPAERMLDAVIRGGTVSLADVEGVVRVLADFYGAAARVTIRPEHYRRRLARDVEANQRALTAPAGLPPAQVQWIHRALLAFLDRETAVLGQRARQGRIIEAHGDLRPEHICLEPRPVIIDRLEFNREFRVMDVADELAFLAMECERLGAPDVGRRVLDIYGDLSGDRPPVALVRFYQAYRASLRAKLALWHTTELGGSQAAAWMPRARGYLDIAALHAAQC
jgi:aminoglycoside phosphotransferase family enzyme